MTIRTTATRVMLTLSYSVVGRLQEDMKRSDLTRSELVEFLLTEHLASADWIRHETRKRAKDLAVKRMKRYRSRKK